MKKLICTQLLDNDSLRKIVDAAPGWEIVSSGERDTWLSHVEEAEIICGWKPEMAERCLSGNAAVRWVQTWGAGVDQLPLKELFAKRVMVTSASGVHPNPVSETAFAMLLAFSRGLHTAVRQQTEGRWASISQLGEIHGKTLGLIGVGAIGQEIARLASAFRMRVLGVRRSGEPAPHVDRMFNTTDLPAVLAESDYIITSLPYTESTDRMFADEQFGAMKPGAVFINVGRGRTTDTDALIRALRERRIAGAGLDVFEQEPLPAGHPLWSMDNVIITPHNGGVTDRYEERAVDIFVRNLQAYMHTGKPETNLIDAQAHY